MNEDETIKIIKSINKDNKPKLLLHACCGPCTLGVFYQLSAYFDVTIIYYNPNIYPKDEYYKRYEYLQKVQKEYKFKLIELGYNEEEFLIKTKGLEDLHEGGKRCKICFELRLGFVAKYAKENGFDYFTSTLSVSPYKDFELLNSIGNKLEKEIGIKYLYSNFKKHEGYKNSIKLCRELGIYRQNYCGCRYSLRDRDISI